MKPLSTWLPFLNWPKLTPELLKSEVSAGFIVALLMVPQSVAYAALAGMPLVTGLYAALLPALGGRDVGRHTSFVNRPNCIDLCADQRHPFGLGRTRLALVGGHGHLVGVDGWLSSTVNGRL